MRIQGRCLCVLITIGLLSAVPKAEQVGTVSILDFGAAPGTRKDTTPAVRDALKQLRSAASARLQFPKGEYHFWPDRAFEDYCFISNNDDGFFKIAFPLLGIQNLTIDGQGSEFIFHGRIIPFVLKQTRNVRLENFIVDWEVPFHCEAEVLVVNPSESTVDVRVLDGFSYRIDDGRFVFVGEGFENGRLKNLLEFDPVRRESAYRVFDNMQREQPYQVTEVSPRTLRFKTRFRTLPTPGNTLLILQDTRVCPAVSIQDSEDLEVSKVTIHHSGAMGVIAQTSRNIHLKEVQVTPREGSNRLVSTSVDATHFVNCSGLILIEGCRFENQIDDALNVHGIFAEISDVPSRDTIEIRLVQYQQLGVEVAQPGTSLDFRNKTTLASYHQGEVRSVVRLNSKYSRVHFSQPLPESVQVGDLVDNLAHQPDVIVRNCVIQRNRARGVLLKTRGKVLVENNYFHTPGAAIRIAAGISKWYESSLVRDVTIRNNHFDNCNYGVWGTGVLDILQEGGAVTSDRSAYQQSIRIEGNRFEVFDSCVVSAQTVDGLKFLNNRIEKTTAYPRYQDSKVPLVIQNSYSVEVKGNRFLGFEFEKLADLDEKTAQTAVIEE